MNKKRASLIIRTAVALDYGGSAEMTDTLPPSSVLADSQRYLERFGSVRLQNGGCRSCFQGELPAQRGAPV